MLLGFHGWKLLYFWTMRTSTNMLKFGQIFFFFTLLVLVLSFLKIKINGCCWCLCLLWLAVCGKSIKNKKKHLNYWLSRQNTWFKRQNALIFKTQPMKTIIFNKQCCFSSTFILFWFLFFVWKTNKLIVPTWVSFSLLQLRCQKYQNKIWQSLKYYFMCNVLYHSKSRGGYTFLFSSRSVTKVFCFK